MSLLNRFWDKEPSFLNSHDYTSFQIKMFFIHISYVKVTKKNHINYVFILVWDTPYMELSTL
jgi:hypothetical protein